LWSLTICSLNRIKSILMSFASTPQLMCSSAQLFAEIQRPPSFQSSEQVSQKPARSATTTMGWRLNAWNQCSQLEGA
jgi:hypothetical protein